MRIAARTVLCLLAGTAGYAFQSAANAALQSRLGGQAYYDDQLDITWAADAGINGFAPWETQMAWAAGLDIGGVTGWRLPDADVNDDGVIVVCFPGVDPITCADNEMGFLFHINGITLNAPGPFIDISNHGYWTSTDVSVDNPNDAWLFSLATGTQGGFTKLGSFPAMAVHDGDVADVVPDSDGDGIGDASDNCTLVANADQRDTNADGYGNVCDPDLDNNGTVTFGDLAIIKGVFFSVDADADLDGDGAVSFGDLGIMKEYFFGAPGPSGIAP